MKKRYHYNSLLSARVPASDTDQKLILSEIRLKGIENVYFKTRKTADQIIPTLTYKEFQKWEKTDHYDIGEVVINHSMGMLALITDFIDGNSVSKAHLDGKGNYSSAPLEVFNTPQSRRATTKEKLPLQRALSERGIYYNKVKRQFVTKRFPENNPYVSVWIMDDLVGVGIFKEISEDGNIVFLGYKGISGPFVYNCDHKLGPAVDYILKQAKNKEKILLVEELNGQGVAWHGKLKRFEPLNLRRKKGQRYYYLSSIWRVKSTIEEMTDGDYRRYKVLNYYHTKPEAEQFKRAMTLRRQQQLLGEDLDLE